MIPVRGVHHALLRVENRISQRLFKLWKKGEQPLSVEDIALAVRYGLYSGYIFGKVAAKANIARLTKTHLHKSKKMSETSQFIEVLYFIFKYDKDILKHLSITSHLTQEILNNADEIFHTHSAALKFFDNYSIQLAAQEVVDISHKVTDLIQKTIQEGMSEAEAKKFIAQKLPLLRKARIQAIARTEATRAFNIGNLEEGYLSNVVEKYQYIAVLDDRTTREICLPRNGMIMDANDINLVAHNTPPLHVNCRSMLAPITKYDQSPPVDIQGKSFDNLPPGQQREGDVNVILSFLRSWR